MVVVEDQEVKMSKKGKTESGREKGEQTAEKWMDPDA